MKGLLAGLLVVLVAGAAVGQQPDPEGQVAPGEAAVHEAYLFAHMIHADYGRLYYTVSRDGLHWEALNGGKRVNDEYHGHPDICVGHDGRWYLVGNRGDGAEAIDFWVSEDLVTWERYGEVRPDLKATPGYGDKAMQRIGAPKLYFEAGEYLLTWHTPHEMGPTNLPEPYWASQRTLYVTSKDLKEFAGPPRRLFPEMEMATIDTIVRKEGERYYAIIKDERYASLDWVTGKTIRICEGPTRVGPWSEPGAPISPNFREAPTLIPSPNGEVWYLYYEQYPGVSYGLSVGASLEGPWYQASGYTFHADWDKYGLPAKVRHGCMIVISGGDYERLVERFGKE